MKVYVDFEELDVEDRPTYICNKYNLQVKSINSGTRYENIKLLSLTDYTKQVRKEVCDDLVKMLTDRAELIQCGSVAEFMFTTYDLQESVKEILDQIQGETKL